MTIHVKSIYLIRTLCQLTEAEFIKCVLIVLRIFHVTTVYFILIEMNQIQTLRKIKLNLGITNSEWNKKKVCHIGSCLNWSNSRIIEWEGALILFLDYYKFQVICYKKIHYTIVWKKVLLSGECNLVNNAFKQAASVNLYKGKTFEMESVILLAL